MNDEDEIGWICREEFLADLHSCLDCEDIPRERDGKVLTLAERIDIQRANLMEMCRKVINHE